ncbi:hypothetical protein Dimus_037782, partial [Dionaea muscipula]
ENRITQEAPALIDFNQSRIAVPHQSHHHRKEGRGNQTSAAMGMRTRNDVPGKEPKLQPNSGHPQQENETLEKSNADPSTEQENPLHCIINHLREDRLRKQTSPTGGGGSHLSRWGHQRRRRASRQGGEILENLTDQWRQRGAGKSNPRDEGQHRPLETIRAERSPSSISQPQNKLGHADTKQEDPCQDRHKPENPRSRKSDPAPQRRS